MHLSDAAVLIVAVILFVAGVRAHKHLENRPLFWKSRE